MASNKSKRIMNLLACSASVAFSPASAWVRLTHPSFFYCGVGINDLPLGSLSNFSFSWHYSKNTPCTGCLIKKGIKEFNIKTISGFTLT